MLQTEEDSEDMSLQINPRSVWGGGTPRWSTKLHLPVSYTFTAYTYTSPCISQKSCIKEVQFLDKHATQIGKCPTIRYNFLIGGDGSIYEGRGWYSRPALPPKYRMFNVRSLYIGLIGIFREFPPSDSMYEAQLNLIHFGVENRLIRKRHLAFSIKPAGRLLAAL